MGRDVEHNGKADSGRSRRRVVVTWALLGGKRLVLFFVVILGFFCGLPLPLRLGTGHGERSGNGRNSLRQWRCVQAGFGVYDVVSIVRPVTGIVIL